MKSLFKIIEDSLRETVLLILFLTLFALSALPACAQLTGTYVVPRVYTLYTGTAGSNATVNLTPVTNLLNYSGWHSITVWATTQSTNNGLSEGSNDVLTLSFSPGTGNGYTNSVLGTNYVWTTPGAGPTTWTWSFTNAAAGAGTVVYTNIAQQFGDSVAAISGTLKVGGTNCPVQIDIGLTP